mgnify:CR=1 FL=1
MKAIYVSKGPLQNLTVGKTYEVLQGADGRWAVIDDDGDVEYWILEERFRPVPDPVPEPVNEWMQVRKTADRLIFVNMNMGYFLIFIVHSRDAYLGKIGSDDGAEVPIDKEYAEAFAQMVGYKWEG